ncbi:MAG: hypothetical protein K9J83_00335 [Desulfarculaceae bacterium]|nr:hypothetical protein [Desulfarculaceae bacterium]
MKRVDYIVYFIKLYNLVWKAAIPFLKKSSRLKKGFDKRVSAVHFERSDLWIHAASAGEAYLALEILKAIQPGKPLCVLLTATTDQGKEIIDRCATSCQVSSALKVNTEWCPFDMPEIIGRAVDKIRPSVMVLLETEIWPGLLYCLKQRDTKIFIVNGRLSPKSFKKFSKTAFIWSKLAPDRILATSEDDMKRFARIFKKSHVSLIPNIKFDALPQNNTLPAGTEVFLSTDSKLVVLASIRAEEERLVEKLLEKVSKNCPNACIAIFPRHMHRIGQWQKHLDRLGFNWTVKSRLRGVAGPGSVILWDVFGELKTAYAHADAAFVGGSLKPLGGQNFVEPAVFGVPTVTGPFTDDFQWVGPGIFGSGVVFKARNWRQAAAHIVQVLENGPPDKTDRKKTAVEYITKHQGGAGMAAEAVTRAVG